MLIVCLVLLSLSVILVQQTHSYDSDDVSWQTTLLSWSPFSGAKAYVGSKDNFIINLPFILLANHLVGPGRTQLLLTSLLMALVNYVLFYFASIYFLKKAKIKLNYKTLMPFIWLSSFGVGLISLFLNTAWRDYEIGVSFVYFVLAAKYYHDEIKPFNSLLSKLVSAVCLFIVALFVQSDPYFFYLSVLPVATFFVIEFIFKKVTKQKLIIVLAWTLLSVLIAKVMTSMLARIGIFEPHGGIKFIGLKSLGPSFVHFIQGTAKIFGISGSGLTIWAIANLLLVLLILYFLLNQLLSKQLLNKLKSVSVETWLLFFCVVLLLVAAACIVVDRGGIYSYRYLVLAVYLGVLILAIKAASIKGLLSSAIVGILLVAALSNTYSSYSTYRLTAKTATPNKINLDEIAVVRKLGLIKGYAGYWDGNINTYFAQNIQFLPVTCYKDQTVPLRLLVNGQQFKDLASKTFIMYDPGMSPRLCSLNQMIAQFGRPLKQIKLSNKTILVYNYDLFSKMGDTAGI